MPQLTISEVYKGGSIGKGTTVPGDFDVDLVIYTRCELLCTLYVDYKSFSIKCLCP